MDLPRGRGLRRNCDRPTRRGGDAVAARDARNRAEAARYRRISPGRGTGVRPRPTRRRDDHRPDTDPAERAARAYARADVGRRGAPGLLAHVQRAEPRRRDRAGHSREPDVSGRVRGAGDRGTGGRRDAMGAADRPCSQRAGPAPGQTGRDPGRGHGRRRDGRAVVARRVRSVSGDRRVGRRGRPALGGRSVRTLLGNRDPGRSGCLRVGVIRRQ